VEVEHNLVAKLANGMFHHSDNRKTNTKKFDGKNKKDSSSEEDRVRLTPSREVSDDDM
jgi:hypothetical protein